MSVREQRQVCVSPRVAGPMRAPSRLEQQRGCRRRRDRFGACSFVELQLAPRASIGPARLRCVACALVATSASLAISAERPAISERRCATLAGSNLLSVPAPERNQGFGLSGHGDGRPEGAAGLAAGEYEVRNHARVDTRFRCGACTPPATCGWSCPTTGGLRSRWGRADRCLGCPCERGPWLCRGPYICGILPRLIGRPVWVTGRPEAGAVLRGISGASGLSPAAQRRWAAKNCVVVAAPFATSEMWSTPG